MTSATCASRLPLSIALMIACRLVPLPDTSTPMLNVEQHRQYIGELYPGFSSTKLLAKWIHHPTIIVDHFVLKAQEINGSHVVTDNVDGSKSTHIFQGLKMSTTYSITLTACLDYDCNNDLKSNPPLVQASNTTSEEYWWIQGTGHQFSDAHIIAENSSVLASPYVFGDEAPEELQGKVRLYFKTLPKNNRSDIRVALSDNIATEDPFSVANFTVEIDTGLRDPDTATETIDRIAAVHAVPLAVEMGGNVRMFFEAEAEDGSNRLLELDSVDGWIGSDFNPGNSGIMESHEDWEETKITIDNQDSGLFVVRQSKVALPLLDDWLWDGNSETFMMITGGDECGQTNDGIFHADWDGNEWIVAKDANGCAIPIAMSAHGPVIVHLGEDRYKLYYEARMGSPNQPNNEIPKPLRVLYIEGGSDVTNWEDESSAREVNFIWPDGTPFTDSEESGLGDHYIYCPTGTLSNQIMYLNMGGMDDPENQQVSRGVGMAVLLNG